MKITVKIPKSKMGEIQRRVRAGIWFTPDPTECDVTAEQKAAIEADPYLEVVSAAAPAAPAPAPKKSKE